MGKFVAIRWGYDASFATCVWGENWLNVAWNRSDLLDFELAEEQEMAYWDRLQVPGATCLGGGHLPTPD